MNQYAVNVGIGTSSPHAPLQFANANGRKLVLYEDAPNDNSYYGFAMGASTLRYQTRGDHVFYVGMTDTSSSELMRIRYDGNIGIGISDPQQRLHVAGSGIISGNLGIGTVSPQQKLDVSGKVTIKDSLGIGVVSPHAPLQFANANGRKLVLYEDAPNDNSYYGFGIGPYMVRYQTVHDHVFYVGTSDTTSLELMRIKQNGNVGIGISAPQQKLHVAGTAVIKDSLGIGTTSPHAPLQFANTTGRKLVLYEDVINDNQYYGMAVDPSTLRFQTDNEFAFFKGTSTSASDEQMRIKGNGNVGIGTATIQEKLTVNGAVKIADGGYTGLVQNATTPVPNGGPELLLFPAIIFLDGMVRNGSN